jgi:hypothetical protein
VDYGRRKKFTKNGNNDKRKHINEKSFQSFLSLCGLHWLAERGEGIVEHFQRQKIGWSSFSIIFPWSFPSNLESFRYMFGLLDNEQSEVFQPIGKLSKKYSYIQI